MSEDRIQISQEIIQELLTTLGEAWGEIEQLKAELASHGHSPASRQASSAAVAAKTSEPTIEEQAESLEASADNSLGLVRPLRRGVLIVDDSKVLQMRLRSFIEPLGYAVLDAADSGATGAELAINLRPQLIIIDHQMPDMNGLDCVKAIRERNTDSRIVICSAFITTELGREYAELGVSEILAKPIQLDLFVRAVHRGMDSLVD